MSKYKTSILNRYLADSIDSAASSENHSVSRNFEALKNIPQNGGGFNLENAESLKNKNQPQSRKRPSGSTTDKLYRESNLNFQSSKKLKLSSEQPRPILPMQPNFLLFPPFSSNVDAIIRPGLNFLNLFHLSNHYSVQLYFNCVTLTESIISWWFFFANHNSNWLFSKHQFLI